MNAQAIQRGIGRGRDPFLIRRFLAERGLKQGDFSRLVGISDSVTSDKLRGIRNNRRVLQALENMGCPSAYLYGKESARQRAA